MSGCLGVIVFASFCMQQHLSLMSHQPIDISGLCQKEEEPEDDTIEAVEVSKPKAKKVYLRYTYKR